MTTTRVILSYPWHGICDRKYVCPLPDDVQGIAKTELREDESGREQALQQMLDWIKKNPDIRHCRADHSFLLRFLRVKKFSVPMAEQTLLKYLNLRQTFPQYCKNLDFLSPKVQELITNGYIFASPKRDRFGRRVIIAIARKFDPYKFSSSDMAKAHLVTYETLLEDEEAQVMGFTHVADIKGVSAAHITLWSPSEFTTLMKWGEQSVPMRHKEIHCINVPGAMRYAYDFARSRFSHKMRNRFMIHNSIEDLHDKLDPEVLPKEYGGSIPMDKMIDLWKQKLIEKREQLLSLDKIELLDNKCVSSRYDSNNNQTSKKTGITHLAGSFRKLEVD